MIVMIAKSLVIYACGGGHGHLVRAINYATLVSAGYQIIHILCYKKAIEFAPKLPKNTSLYFESWSEFIKVHDFHCSDLVMDTFPLGHKGEVSIEDLELFQNTRLMARYSESVEHREHHHLFDEILLPYGEVSEWGSEVEGTKIGVLTKENPCHIVAKKGNFAFVDPGKKIPQATIRKLTWLCLKNGMELNYYSKFDQEIMGEKVLVIGAGYNTFYELYQQSENIRFLPLKKKYDNQFKRVELYSKGVTSLDEVLNWIEGAACA